MTYEEIKNFIINNSIKRRTDLFEKSKKIYKFFKMLSKQEQDVLLPTGLNYKSNFNTIADFQEFIKSNCITSRGEFRHRFPILFNKFNEIFTKDEQEIILPYKNNLYPTLITEDDFKKFIEDNAIVGREDFHKRFPAAYEKFRKLKDESKNLLLPKIDNRRYTDINTKEDIINFIFYNNIKSRSELYNEYAGAYDRFLKLLTKEEQNSIFPLRSYDDLNSEEDFAKFIKENKITGRGDFSKRYRNGYSKFIKVLNKEEQDRVLPSLVIQDYTGMKTKEDFSEFIQKNNIRSRKQFETLAYKGYVRFKTLLQKEEQDELLPLKYRNFSFLTDFESFKLFIQENNIISRKDLDSRFGSGAYERFRKLSEDEKETLLPIIKSLGEIQIYELLTDNFIKFETEKTYPDLRGDGDTCLRFDFYLLDYNILLEYHGSQHFNPNTDFYTERGIELDKIKYNYAKVNNIPLLYFTNEVYYYERFGYFTEVITDADILIQKIKEIGLTNQSNS